MKLARVIRTGGSWMSSEPSNIDKPPIGTIVQYESDCHGRYNVYFPGVQGYASIHPDLFDEYFESL